MLRSQKRLLALIAALPVLLLLSAFMYMFAMANFEGEPRSFLQSLEFVAETLSTTGYGSDSSWSNPVVVLFVIVLQFGGVFLIFLIFPIYLIPFLEERFEVRLPTEAQDLEEGAIVIYEWGPAVASLVEELERGGVPSLLIEKDADEARRQADRGRRVVVGDVDDGVFGRVRLERARALVVNGTDDENAAAILSAMQVGFVGEILAIVEEPFHRKPMMLAGATAVFTPRHILGAALAARASARLNPRVLGAQSLGRKLVVREVRIRPESEFAGRTLREAGIGSRVGVTVIGQWVDGRLHSQPTADTRLEPGGVVIVAGGAESVRRFSEESGGTEFRADGPFVIAGFGEVGKKVHQLLTDVGEETLVIDRDEVEGVDVVGDVLDLGVLEQAGARDAQAVILAVDLDSATLFATVILKDFAPEVPVIARVNRVQNVERIHRAGADFALSISQVAGQILAGKLLGRESISVDPQLKILKVSHLGLEGKRPSELEIRERSGASVVAVERDDELMVDLGGDFRFRDGDDVYLCGSEDAIEDFLEQYPR